MDIQVISQGDNYYCIKAKKDNLILYSNKYNSEHQIECMIDNGDFVECIRYDDRFDELLKAILNYKIENNIF